MHALFPFSDFNIFVCCRSVNIPRKMFVLLCLWMSRHSQNCHQKEILLMIVDILAYGKSLS